MTRPSARRWGRRASPVLFSCGLFVATLGCATAPPPTLPSAPPQRSIIPEPPRDSRAIATEHFYRGKAFALSGDPSCARVEFEQALDEIRLHSRPGDPDDLEFAQQLWESVSLYRAVTEGRTDLEERPPAEETPDSLIAVAPAPSAEEVEKVKAEVAPDVSGFDVPVVVNDAVLKAIAFYQFRTPQAFAGALKRSGRFLPMMRKILSEQGLPQDLVFVAMIESAFKPAAHSRRGAHGFWQFIDGTGKRYGLKRTKHVDERSDPVKSTRAAAAYFRDLYEMFGDWHLAMAGYDSGEGKIIRGLQRTGARDYWELAGGSFLQRETRDYVPFVLAAALISKDPARYGFDVIPDPPLDFEVVLLDRPVDLARVAEKLQVPLEELRLLNGELRTRVTPPGPPSYALRVPAGSGDLLRASSLPPAPPVEERKVTVKKGDTLPRLAARYRINVAELAEWNDLAPNAKLRPGTTLALPPRNGQPTRVATRAPSAERRAPSKGEIRALPTPAAAVHAATDPRVAESGARSGQAVPDRVEIPAEGFETSDVPKAIPAKKKAASTYTVKKGDTLFRIATRYGVTVEAIRKKNRLGPSDPLPVGKRLAVPAASGR